MSQLETRNVFLDTKVYFRSGFNLHKKSLTRLRDLCRKGFLNLYITDIVKSECRAHLRDAIAGALNELKRFQRQGVVLQRVESSTLSPLFQPLSEDEIQQQAWQQFQNYLSACNATEISCKNVDPCAVFDLYFSRSAPFGTGKKKSEFPDAFSFRALSQAVGDEKCYLITGDKDAKGIEEENLFFVDELDKFLDLYTRAESRADLLALSLKSAKQQLAKDIKDSLEDFGAYSDLEPEAEVVEFTVNKVTILDILIVNIGDTAADISVYTEIEYTATLTEPDYDTATYDREDDFYIFHNDPHVYSGTETDTEKVGVTVDFTETEDSIEIEGFSGASIEGKEWGFPVRISRDGWPYK